MSDSESEERTIDVGTYEGERDERARRHGQGKCTYANNDTYEGSYSEGKRSGSGTYTWNHPKQPYSYTGHYQDGLRNGHGKLVFPDGSTFEGNWEQGKPSGSGHFVFINQDEYTGELLDGKFHGTGKYVFSSTGQVLDGLWDQNSFVQGQWELEPFLVWVGTFSQSQPLGDGYFLFKKLGYKQYGTYVGTYENAVENEEENESESEENLEKVVKLNPKNVYFVPGRMEKL
ncbi:hypothetical protein RCL1_004773 [Eukaryota sp. TZLM3-RCL]